MPSHMGMHGTYAYLTTHMNIPDAREGEMIGPSGTRPDPLISRWRLFLYLHVS